MKEKPHIRYTDDYHCIVEFESLKEFYELMYPGTPISEFKPPNSSYEVFVTLHRNAGLCDEKCTGDIMNPQTCGFAAQFQKGFMIRNTSGLYSIVHPDDYDKVERIVNCTLDPIHDLIHELRYHPVIGIDANIARKRHREVIGE
jgi:hypothetical protein